MPRLSESYAFHAMLLSLFISRFIVDASLCHAIFARCHARHALLRYFCQYIFFIAHAAAAARRCSIDAAAAAILRRHALITLPPPLFVSFFLIFESFSCRDAAAAMLFLFAP